MRAEFWSATITVAATDYPNTFTVVRATNPENWLPLRRRHFSEPIRTFDHCRRAIFELDFGHRRPSLVSLLLPTCSPSWILSSLTFAAIRRVANASILFGHLAGVEDDRADVLGSVLTRLGHRLPDPFYTTRPRFCPISAGFTSLCPIFNDLRYIS